MSDVNLSIVREFFELNRFRVMTKWEHEQGRSGTGDQGLQLYVLNTAPPMGIEPSFSLTPSDLPAIQRALVEIRAWHSDRFYPSVIESSPALRRVAEAESLSQASDHFMSHDFKTILVMSELPVSADQRARSIELLRQFGIDHVIEFPTMFRDMLDKVNVNANYAASPNLQLLRLLKGYGFIQNQQLELVFPTEPRPQTRKPEVDTVDIESNEEQSELDHESHE